MDLTTTTTLDAPPDPAAADGPLAELAARCRRQHPACVLLEARFRPAAPPDPGEAARRAQWLRRRLRSDDEVHPLGGLAFGLLLRRTGAAGADRVAGRLQRQCGGDGLVVRRLVPPETRGGAA